MSTPNLTFSRNKNRELSPLEARIGSIRKRLVDAFGKKNNLKSKTFPSALRDHLAAMGPRNKGRRNETFGGWETSEADEPQNGSGKQAGTGDLSNNGHASKNASGRRSRQSRGGSAQNEHQPGLGPWTQAVSETVKTIGAAQRAIRDLEDKFLLHKDALSMMDETRTRLDQLEEACKDKDEEIQRQGITITTLKNMDQKAKTEIERKQSEIEKDKQWLDQEIAKQKKRVSVAMEEEKHKLDNEMAKLLTQHGKSFDKRKKELEDGFVKQRDENSRRVSDLESERERLRAAVEESKKTMQIQGEKLEQAVEQCDVLKRAKDSVKVDNKALERELDMMKKEFALSSKSKDYFKRKLAEIQSRIEGISLKYFNDLEGKDLEKVHSELVAADGVFASVPIDDSDDSCKLRAAHAQRIISNAICQYIWKPFCSELTLCHPALSDLLGKISDELDKSGHSGRTANVWTALTMRALQSLPGDSLPRNLEPKESTHPVQFGRAESVVSKVFSVLAHLVSSPHHENLRKDLRELSNSAINIWNDAQTGQLKIMVSPSLEYAHREEWRSQEFDPASPDNGDPKLDVVSKTHPRIFTLFPQVIALEAVDPVGPNADLPGSWPKESEPLPRMAETCIHPGKGLPESSGLVVRGKEVQKEKDDYLLWGLENLKKEIHSIGHSAGQNRRESMGSSMSGPPSPSERWKREGAMKFQEK